MTNDMYDAKFTAHSLRHFLKAKGAAIHEYYDKKKSNARRAATLNLDEAEIDAWLATPRPLPPPRKKSKAQRRRERATATADEYRDKEDDEDTEVNERPSDKDIPEYHTGQAIIPADRKAPKAFTQGGPSNELQTLRPEQDDMNPNANLSEVELFRLAKSATEYSEAKEELPVDQRLSLTNTRNRVRAARQDPVNDRASGVGPELLNAIRRNKRREDERGGRREMEGDYGEVSPAGRDGHG
jgi:hypothetical protein